VLGLRDLGPAISPFNAFMILTGIETLPLRMAQALREHAGGRQVPSPAQAGGVGELRRPQRQQYHDLAKRICPKGAAPSSPRRQGRLRGGRQARLQARACFSHLANIGDTRSLVIHPASTTHRQLTDAQRKSAGAGDDVVRLSIGLEDKADIIADLAQALAA